MPAPSAAAHGNESHAHETVAQYLGARATQTPYDPYRQWAVVLIFHAALHAVQETLISRYQADPQNHRDRRRLLQQYYQGTAGYTSYMRLYHRAHSA